MAIKCDNCNEDVTPNSDMGETYRHVVELNGGKKCFCTDCWSVLGDWACSDEHRKVVKEYKKEFE